MRRIALGSGLIWSCTHDFQERCVSLGTDVILVGHTGASMLSFVSCALVVAEDKPAMEAVSIPVSHSGCLWGN